MTDDPHTLVWSALARGGKAGVSAESIHRHTGLGYEDIIRVLAVLVQHDELQFTDTGFRIRNIRCQP